MIKLLKTLLPALVLGLLLNACGDDDERYDELISDGWQAYSAADYDPALTTFLDAVREDGDRAEAWNGIAWTEIELYADEESDEDYLAAIEGNFLAAIDRSHDWAPPLAGLALTRSRLEKRLSAIHFAGEALTLAGDDWTYSRIATVTARAMRKVRAWNFFLLEQFADARIEVETVLDVTLDPDAPDYLEQLLAAIEQL